MAELGIDEIVSRIVEQTGKSEKAVRQLVGERKLRFSGLLSEIGSGYLIAKELGVSLKHESGLESETKINEMAKGMMGLNVTARITKVFPVREFEANNEKGKMVLMELKDETGSIEFVLWRDQVKKFHELGFGIGSAILLKGARVSEYDDREQLSLSPSGQMILVGEQRGLPKAGTVRPGLSGIIAGMQNLELSGKVGKTGKRGEFVGRNGETGRMASFELEDKNGKIRVVAWNEAVESAEGLLGGDTIRISGASARKGLDGKIELHVNEAKGIELKEKIYLPKIGENNAKRQKLCDINEEELAEARATIAGVNKSRLFYFVCPQCGGKATEKGAGNEFSCAKCGTIRNAKPHAVISIELDDGSARMNCTFFGSIGEELCGKSAAVLQSQCLSNGNEFVLKEIRKRIGGKQIVVEVIAKKNVLRNELEFVARKIRKIDWQKEARGALEEMGK
ncbi:MAG: OB-fold nucleic acid binding domain-containing protein [archaeon]